MLLVCFALKAGGEGRARGARCCSRSPRCVTLPCAGGARLRRPSTNVLRRTASCSRADHDRVRVAEAFAGIRPRGIAARRARCTTRVASLRAPEDAVVGCRNALVTCAICCWAVLQSCDGPRLALDSDGRHRAPARPRCEANLSCEEVQDMWASMRRCEFVGALMQVYHRQRVRGRATTCASAHTPSRRRSGGPRAQRVQAALLPPGDARGRHTLHLLALLAIGDRDVIQLHALASVLLHSSVDFTKAKRATAAASRFSFEAAASGRRCPAFGRALPPGLRAWSRAHPATLIYSHHADTYITGVFRGCADVEGVEDAR